MFSALGAALLALHLPLSASAAARGQAPVEAPLAPSVGTALAPAPDLEALSPGLALRSLSAVPGARARAAPSLPAPISSLAAVPSAPRAPETPGPRRAALAQAAAWLDTQAGRAVTLPAYVWPFTKVAAKIAHGEPLAALTPAGAVRSVVRAAADGPVVVGRLAWEVHDPWTARGVERSYARLIAGLGRARARGSKIDASVSLDLESLGLQVVGLSEAERLALAGDAAVRLARAARAQGLPVEIDMGTSDAMPGIFAIARRLAVELRMPIRLAVAARYGSSFPMLDAWAALARELGAPLGVRLVKGSFIEADNPDAANARPVLRRRYKRLITRALENADALDVAVATHDPQMWAHAKAQARRLGARFTLHAIRGVNPAMQARARREGALSRVYVSYGADAARMGLSELYWNWKNRRALRRRGETRPVE